MRHPQQVKDKAVQRLLEPDRKSISDLSQELDIPEVTLYYWERQIKNGSMGKKIPRILLLTDKQELLIHYQSLPEESKGMWLRENGFHGSDIATWKEEINQALLGIKEYPKKEKELKKLNDQLTKELTKKDKALAEVTALLVFKKKLHSLFGEESEELP